MAEKKSQSRTRLEKLIKLRNEKIMTPERVERLRKAGKKK